MSEQGKPPILPDEDDRLLVLRSCGILDTVPEERFDEVVRLAARTYATPIALVTLVDDVRQWFKARVGLDVPETSRDESFCAHTIAGNGPLVVRDTLEDPRFRENALVIGPPNIRFYAGIPLRSAEGHALGSLCVIDRTPREIDEAQLDALHLLARHIEMELHIRRGMAARAVSVPPPARHPNEHAEIVRTLVTEALDVVTILDSSGRIRFESPSIRDVLGYEPEELIGRVAFEYVHPEDRDAIAAAFDATVAVPGGTERVTFRFRHKDGSWRDMDSFAYHSPGLQIDGILVHSRDVTTRRRAEEALRRSEAELRALSAELARVQKQKDELIGHVIHDLRNPLAAISINSALLVDYATSDDQREISADIQSSAERMQRMVLDLVDIATSEAGELKLHLGDFDIEPMFHEIIRSMRGRASAAAIQLAVEVASPVRVRADRELVRRIIESLLDNAFKYSPRASRIAVGAKAEGARALLWVADNGLNIAEEDRDRVFDKFGRLMLTGGANARAGVGLGLTFCRIAAEAHGGELSAESNTPTGVRFCLKLPVGGPPAADKLAEDPFWVRAPAGGS